MHHAKYIFLIVQNICIVFGYYHEPSIISIFPSMYAVLPNNSYFGYSITYQPKIKSLVISAPMADNIGQVYTYNIEHNNLTKVDFDIERETDSTTDYFLGATVKAGTSFFTTCAPRYLKKGAKLGTFSRCFVKPISQGMQIMQSMTKDDRNFGGPRFEHTMDSFGWSIDVTTHDNILIGGPAMTKGRVIQYKNMSESPQLLTPPIFENEKTATTVDFFNFGYSIASGNFYSDLETDVSYAISTPYGSNGIGQVLFYNENGTYIEDSLKDKESGLGTIFGAALCTVKLGGKRASLFVGAPAYVPEQENNVDLGAVHIYIPNEKSLTLKTTIKGHDYGGRFGSAIVKIGDLDSDQKEDVAIAAPYEDNGKGAVYIYTANNILINNNEIAYTQRLQSESFRAFGLSLTSLQDYDDNGCNELAIGAPDSNAVAVFRCFASVIVNVYNKIPNLQKRGSSERENFTFQSCIKVSYPEKPENITANVPGRYCCPSSGFNFPSVDFCDTDGMEWVVMSIDVSIKIGIMHPSATLRDSKTGVLLYKKSLSSKKGVYCENVVVLTPVDKHIESNSIQITVDAQLEDDPRLSKTFNRQRVILSDRSSVSVSNKIWATGCSSRICVPKLSSEAAISMTNPYIIGSSDAENISITIANSGETAYSACVRVRVDGVRVLQASGYHRDEGEILVCEPRNPVRTNRTWSAGSISLETKSLTSQDKEIHIHIDAYNHCENKTGKTSVEKIVNLKSDTSRLILMREAIPNEIVNVSSVNLETEISHLYTIINNGVTNWIGIKCQIIQSNPFVKIKNPIIIYTNDETRVCILNIKMEKAESEATICDVGNLGKNKKIHVMVNLQIAPMPTDIFDVNKNVSITTKLNLLLNYETMSISVNSTLVRLPIPQVPFWVYICASIVALLVLLVLVIIFYECGFLRRKNKVMLKDLKQEVKRQSVRRTISLRESMHSSENRASEDKNRLINELKDRTKANCENVDVDLQETL